MFEQTLRSLEDILSDLLDIYSHDEYGTEELEAVVRDLIDAYKGDLYIRGEDGVAVKRLAGITLFNGGSGWHELDPAHCEHPANRRYATEYFHYGKDDNGVINSCYPALWIGCLDCGKKLADGVRLKT